ncbi:hypothetical protein FRC06_007840 [Ceratobasidium sp. 370]|nr:hypothetical protein FRC06_007840 [Ceratobasidium sp. 370]
MGRMNAEFLSDEPMQEGTDERKHIVVARGRATRILGFSPREGQSGTIIIVQLVFAQAAFAPNTKVVLRVKMGNIPLVTSILGVLPTEGASGHWQLQAIAPDPIELNVVGLEVPLIVQALNVANGQIVDDVCIGTFKFVSLTNESAVDSTYGGPTSTEDPGVPIHQRAAKYASGRKRTHLSIDVPSRDVPDDTGSEPSPEGLSPIVLRNPPSQSSQKPGEDNTYPGSLEIHGNLDNMTNGWSDDEGKSSRRLVEFFCIQKRGHIDVRFAPIHGNGPLDPNRNVVSCIWWDEMGDFVITSVDTISLLEKLVGTKFTTEEKNRIRRNLQGFKPSTISKNQANCESFFKLLMEFPPPRPRHIEKDVKAFSWSKLESMLEKVISKYWFVTSPGGSEPEEQTGLQKMQVVRDPEGMSDNSLGSVGRAFPTASSTSQLNAEAHASRTDILPAAGYFGAAPSTSDNRSPSQAELLEDSTYPQGPGMGTHNSPTFEPADMLMEISGDSVQELLSLEMTHDHDSIFHPHLGPYPTVPELSATSSLYSHEASVVAGHDFHGDASLTAHILHQHT